MKKAFLIVVMLSVLAGLAHAANPQVTLQISGGVTGSIVIGLYPDEAPVTVANFVDYVQSGHYDGLIFHRVIAGFMIQGGGYDQDLMHRPTNAPILNESTNGLSNLRGTIAMARTGETHSATSQFFINHVNNTPGNLNNLDYGALAYDNYGSPYLKVGYCVFGQVISGMDVVDAIAVTDGTDNDTIPDVDVIIQSATVTLNAPICIEKLRGDVNGDCSVNLADFVEMADNWMLCNAINLDCVTSLPE